MYRTLSDLRILKMAQYLEDMFEAYEEALRDSIAEVPVRARLAILFQDSPAHTSLKSELARLAQEAQRVEGHADSADVLQAMHDCELSAHEFHLRQLDRVSDPRLVALFKRLASEELQHAQAVTGAMNVLKDLRGSR